MIDRADLLTWQGLRDLATCEAFNLASGVAYVGPKAGRAPVILEARGMRHSGAPVPWMQLPDRVTPEPGAIVFARAGWRHPWRLELAQIPVPCVLVTAFHDRAISEAATAAIFTGQIATWFGVQTATTHPQLVPMPVGIDGRRLKTLQAAPRQDGDRDILCYMNFQANHKRPHVKALRRSVRAYFSAQDWVTTERWTYGGDAHYFAQLGRSRFVLSPPGYGWDCYRTYEALAMGAIPIVQRQGPLTAVCEALPVWLVDDWREVTKARCQHEWDARQDRPMPTLTMSYWRERIQAAAREVGTT